jgi:hypothetical protein
MASLTQPRLPKETRYKNIALPLGAGLTAWQGGIACLDTAANVCKPGASGNANLIKVGEFLESNNNSAGTGSSYVMVSLDVEIVLKWYDNATGAGNVTSSYLFDDVYVNDDHSVTTTSSGNSEAGRVWALDPIYGVAVQSLVQSKV